MRDHPYTPVFVTLHKAALLGAFVFLLSACSPAATTPASRSVPSPPQAIASQATAVQATAPRAGFCYERAVELTASAADTVPVDCAGTHLAETVYVGQVPGPSASPPVLIRSVTAATATAQAALYATCDRHASAYIGRAWTDPRFDLRVVLPDSGEWQAGARWFRCDLVQREPFTDTHLDEPRSGSLKGAPMPPLYFTSSSDDQWSETSCTSIHSGEYVGGFLHAPATVDPFNNGGDAEFDRCFKIAAAYLKVSKSRAEALVGVAAIAHDDFDVWSSGRRYVGCYVALHKFINGTIAGKGGAGL